MKNKLILLIPLLALASCGQNKQPDIVVSSFVSYDAVKNIVGDKMTLRNLVPWGSELHGFEPTPKDVVAINKAKLFVYLSPKLDTWVNSLVNNENTFNMSEYYTLHEDESEHDHEHDEHDHDHEHDGVHFFTNPVYYLEIVNHLLLRITSLDNANSAYYLQNHDEYKTNIESSISELRSFLSSIETPTLYFAGHNALDDFAHEFDFKIRALSESYKPEVDFLSPAVIAFIEEIKANNVHHLFIEELAQPRMANLIKSELAKENYHIDILELHGYHNITSSQAKEEITYAKLFNTNVENIKKALSN